MQFESQDQSFRLIPQLELTLARVQTKIKKISKAHKTELSELLGHLEEKYEVDFSIPEGMFTGSIPFAVNLRDKNVDIPLNDWGSGTKPRAVSTRLRTRQERTTGGNPCDDYSNEKAICIRLRGTGVAQTAHLEHAPVAESYTRDFPRLC